MLGPSLHMERNLEYPPWAQTILSGPMALSYHGSFDVYAF